MLAAGELVSRCTAQTGVSLSLDILEELGTPRALAALVASAMAEKAPRSSHMQPPLAVVPSLIPQVCLAPQESECAAGRGGGWSAGRAGARCSNPLLQLPTWDMLGATRSVSLPAGAGQRLFTPPGCEQAL